MLHAAPGKTSIDHCEPIIGRLLSARLAKTLGKDAGVTVDDMVGVGFLFLVLCGSLTSY